MRAEHEAKKQEEEDRKQGRAKRKNSMRPSRVHG